MARQSVESEQGNVQQQYQRADADAKALRKKERANRVPPKEDEVDDCEIKKPPMEILQNERKCGFAAVAPMPSFAYRAGWRIEEERPVIRLSIVVAGSAESQGPGQNQKCRRKAPPMVTRDRSAESKTARGTVPTHRTCPQRRESCVKTEPAQQHDDGQNFNPPRIPPLRAAETADLNHRRGLRHGDARAADKSSHKTSF